MKFNYIKYLSMGMLAMAMLFTSCEDEWVSTYVPNEGVTSDGQSGVGDRDESEYDLETFEVVTGSVKITLPEGSAFASYENGDGATALDLYIGDKVTFGLEVSDESLPAADSSDWEFSTSNAEAVNITTSGYLIAGAYGIATVSVSYIDYENETIYTDELVVNVAITFIESIVIKSATGENIVEADSATLELSVEVYPADATFSDDISWSLSDESLSWIANVNTEGLVTGYAAATGVELSIIASANDGSGVYAEFPIVVEQNSSLYFSLTADELEFANLAGESQTLYIAENKHTSYVAELSYGDQYFELVTGTDEYLGDYFTVTTSERNDSGARYYGELSIAVYQDRFIRGYCIIPISQKAFEPFTIGDYDGKGGIVYEIDESGNEEWYKAFSIKEDNSASANSIYWSNSIYVDLGAYSQDDGYYNTMKIYNADGYSSSNYPAAAWCIALNTTWGIEDDYSVEGGQGWYFPAFDEMAHIVGIYGGVNGTLGSEVAQKAYANIAANNGDTKWQSAYYWSSTEDDGAEIKYSGLTITTAYATVLGTNVWLVRNSKTDAATTDINYFYCAGKHVKQFNVRAVRKVYYE